MTNSTLRKIQTLSSCCNHPNKHIHLYLPLNVPSILHSARLQYLTLNLLLLLSQCVSVMFCLADCRQQQCVSVQWAGPDTFALLYLLSTVVVIDLPTHRDPLLDIRMDCTHKYNVERKVLHTQAVYTKCSRKDSQNILIAQLYILQ